MRGISNPLFYCSKVKKEVLQIVESVIDGNQFFVIDTHIAQIKGTWMIKISADSDKGIGIDECSILSRAIDKKIEDEFPEVAYEIEITSPGVGEPLKMQRQYLKNRGREVKVWLTDGKELIGKLVDAIPDKEIVIEEYEKKKGKIITTKRTEIQVAEIKRTEVQISFN